MKVYLNKSIIMIKALNLIVYFNKSIIIIKAINLIIGGKIINVTKRNW